MSASARVQPEQFGSKFETSAGCMTETRSIEAMTDSVRQSYETIASDNGTQMIGTILAIGPGRMCWITSPASGAEALSKAQGRLYDELLERDAVRSLSHARPPRKVAPGLRHRIRDCLADPLYLRRNCRVERSMGQASRDLGSHLCHCSRCSVITPISTTLLPG